MSRTFSGHEFEFQVHEDKQAILFCARNAFNQERVYLEMDRRDILQFVTMVFQVTKYLGLKDEAFEVIKETLRKFMTGGK